MLHKKKILFLIELFWMFFLLACSRNYNPFVPEYHLMDSWPNIIMSSGIGSPDRNLPPPQQRMGALKAAKIDLIRNLCDSVTCLQISDYQSIENLLMMNDSIFIEINDYVRTSYIMTDIYFLSSEDVQVDGLIVISGIKNIVNKYIAKFD
jgi:hypothetical protein